MKNKRYRIGLDIGITSVGWAVIEDNEDGEPIGILDLGSRIFNAAEVPKTGAPIAKIRREKRGTRRRNRRKVHRIERVKKLLLENNIITEVELNKLYETPNNIYELRVKGLDELLNDYELSKVLINFVKKRGYKSNSKSEESKQSDNSKVLSCIRDNEELLKKYRSVGEMYCLDEKFKDKIRNTTDNYKTTVERKSLLKEIELILTKQSELNNKITNNFINKYIEIFCSQRNFDEGPALPSKFGGNLIESMLGNCTFEKDEKRAPKATFTFENFKLLQDLNSIKLEKLNIIVTEKGNTYHRKTNDIRTLTFEEKEIIIKEFTKRDKNTYAQIRKALNLSYDYIFNMINYEFKIKDLNNKDNEIKEIIDEVEKKSKSLSEMQSFHILRKALDKYEKDYITKLSTDEIDNITTILTLYKGDQKRIEELGKININDDIVNYLLPLSFSKVSHLSIKAMKELIQELEKGITYDKADTKVSSDHRGIINTNKKSKIYLNDLKKITNPVVRRGVSQTLKVLNAIVNKYGDPELVNIELAREIGKNFQERRDIEKSQTANLEANINAVNEIKSAFNKENITGQDIVKFKLWKEQNELCIYSGEHIDISDLFTKAVDVDHIIPYSKCFDDSYNNKVLVKASENRMKSNRTPIEYLTEENKNVDEYITRVEAIYKNKFRKRKNLLKESFTEDDKNNWKERNLKDTQYMSKYILNAIQNNLNILPNENISENKRVMAVKGGITSQVRKRLNLNKTRDNDKHHAMDAAVIAITTESMVQRITAYEQRRESKLNDRNSTKEEFNERFPMPYKEFEDELKARLKDTDEEVENAITLLNKTSYKLEGIPKAIFVSRMPKHKVKGSAHKETILGKGNEGKLVKKVALIDLKLDKDNEIKDYYNKQDDKILYNALKERLIQFDGDAKEAFKEKFYKPKADGSQGPLVKKVKLEEVSSSNLELTKMQGVAGNGDMVRIDMFYVEGEGYYFVPIYVADTIKDELPKFACVAAKKPWKEMNDDNFVFSLYPSDLIYIESKKGIKLSNAKKEEIVINQFLGYYVRANISTAAVMIETHDRMYNQSSLGIKNLQCIKKYQVDVLGNYSEVKLPEKRMKFNINEKRG